MTKTILDILIQNIQYTFTKTFSSELYLTFGCPLAAIF